MSLKYIKEYDNFLNENKKTKIIAYHGSGTKFEKFSMKHRYDNNGNIGADLGHWFAFNRKDVIGASASYSKDMDKKLNDLLKSQRVEQEEFTDKLFLDYKDDILKAIEELIEVDLENSRYWVDLKIMAEKDFDKFKKDIDGITRFLGLKFFDKLGISIFREIQNIVKQKQKGLDDIYNELKESEKTGYIYKVELTLNKVGEVDGENIGTGWGRFGEITSHIDEGYDALIIRNADTGYYIGDEIVVFKDKNIKILDIEEIHF